jgi:hypothetical protein
VLSGADSKNIVKLLTTQSFLGVRGSPPPPTPPTPGNYKDATSVAAYQLLVHPIVGMSHPPVDSTSTTSSGTMSQPLMLDNAHCPDQ